MSNNLTSSSRVAIIGGGPAGLMAADVISRSGISVAVYDTMPSLGRKFLMAGKSGLNLTHAEALDTFLSRYGERRAVLEPIIRMLGPDRLRAWAHELGVNTFVGSSGRVFPDEMKAAPLLRAWLHRLRASGVRFHVRHHWLGFADDRGLHFMTPQGPRLVHAAATVLALGGGSWARLGSTGAWVSLLHEAGIKVIALRPANCGFDVKWSSYLRERYAGEPVKSVLIRVTDAAGVVHARRGEFVITASGVEGSLIYSVAAMLRDVIARDGRAIVQLDLMPDWAIDRVQAALSRPRGKRSMAEHLRRQLGLRGVKAALLRELAPAESFNEPVQLAALIKALPLPCERTRPIDEAISTAGGVAFEALTEQLMLKELPGVFCAGEMLDWEAPTGGYLLTACFASGYVAGQGVLQWLRGD